MRIGCHISIAGGIQNAPLRAFDLGCECFQIFTRSPQGGKAPDFTKELCENFKIQNSNFKIKAVYVHTPYYINFASANNRIRYGSVNIVRDELERASLIGANYVITHLGSAGELSEEAIANKVSEMLIKTLDGYTGSAELLIENSAGAGKIIGASFSQIAEIIKKTHHPKLTGICLDTQHSFASGYDWRNFENTIQTIDSEIGIEHIKLIHANDSLTDFASRKDRHAHIGEGLIGIEVFKKIVAFAEKQNIDLVLETEFEKVADDIELLKKFRN